MLRLVLLSFVVGLCAVGNVCFGQAEGEAIAEQPWTARESRLIDKPDEIVARLENGMAAIVKENHTAPVAAVRLYVRTGSIYEEEYLGSGISHLFEHLLAGAATKTRSEDESRKLIQQIGARYNAYTTKDVTCYFLTVPSQHVGTALNLIADWVTRPLLADVNTIDQVAFEREWGVVQRELEMKTSDPMRQFYRLYDEIRYHVHPARYPVIGHQRLVQRVTKEDIVSYYQRKYVPDNVVISIAGDINAEEMLGAIKKEFSDFERRSIASSTLPQEPPVTAPRKLVKVMEEMRGPAMMMVGYPSFKLQDADLYALDTLATILGEGQSSRLYRALREQQQLVLSVSSWNYTPDWAEGTFVVQCEVEPGKVEAAKAAIREQIARVKNEAVSEAELARAKRQMQVSHIRGHQTAEQQASAMARDYMSTGDPHFSDHYVEEVQKVSAEQLLAAAQKYLVDSKELMVVVSGVALEKAGDTAAVGQQETTISKIELDNGMRVLLKRNTAVPLVSMQLYVLGGLLDETDETNGITNLMARASMKGTASYSAEQIAGYFDRIGGQMVAGSGNNTFYYNSEVMAQDFAEALGYFSEIVQQPRFAAEEVAKVKEEILAELEQIHNTWRQRAERHFRDTFFVNSPYKRTREGRTEVVGGLTGEQLKAFHQQVVAGQRAVLAIFGDIDLAQAEQLVRQHFSALAAGTPLDLNQFAAEPAITQPRRVVEATEKQGATVTIGYPGMKLTDIQDRYPMEVLQEIVGSTSGWLFETLRGAQLVYYARGMNFPSLLPGYFAGSAQCEAEKVPEVIEAMRGLLAKAAAGTISDEELSLAKSNRINAEILGKQTNASAAMNAALDELYGFGFDWSKGHADRILGVSLEDVKAVAKKYLSVAETVTVVTSAPEVAAQKTEPGAVGN